MPQCGWDPCLGSKCSVQTRSIKRRSPKVSRGKCAGTQSRITPMSFLVHRIHKIAEVIRRSVSCCRCVMARYLITPGFISGCSITRHQLNYGCSRALSHKNQHRSDLTVVIKFTAIVRFSRSQDALHKQKSALCRPVTPRFFISSHPARHIFQDQPQHSHCSGRSCAAFAYGSDFRYVRPPFALISYFIDVARANTGDKSS